MFVDMSLIHACSNLQINKLVVLSKPPWPFKSWMHKTAAICSLPAQTAHGHSNNRKMQDSLPVWYTSNSLKIEKKNPKNRRKNPSNPEHGYNWHLIQYLPHCHETSQKLDMKKGSYSLRKSSSEGPMMHMTIWCTEGHHTMCTSARCATVSDKFRGTTNDRGLEATIQQSTAPGVIPEGLSMPRYEV